MYSEKDADRVCDLIADGIPLRAIEKMDGLPSRRIIMQWLNGGRTPPCDDFAARYARAMAARMDAMAEEILDIADDDSLDIGFDDEGKPFVKGENIQRAKLRVDTRKWLMAKMAPKKYGDSMNHRHSGDAENPVQIVSASDKDVLAHFVKTRGKDYDDGTDS